MEVSFIEASIVKIYIHKVGNKIADEGYKISKEEVRIDNELNVLLSHYFLSHFKSEEQYHFYHDTDLSFNETYSYVSLIFENIDQLLKQSSNLAQHLYNKSSHPKIKGGEFYTVYFKGCLLNGETVDAVGLFKTENKDTFLEVEQMNEGYEVESKQGLNLNKLDKGTLIFNTQKENGYLTSIVDNANRSLEAQYWKDEFLNVQPLKNEFLQTNEFLRITKKFDNLYRDENDIELSDNFEISRQAVKKQARVFKSVLKLDKNFHIYIHGNKELIKQGVEKDGRKYYKIYYENEI